jgi:hypothetical protein
VRTTDTGETGYEQVQEMPFESTSAD